MNIFAYGTLMIPSVMQAVTGKHFASKEAVLRGYDRFRIKEEFYPGVIEKKEAIIDGAVYLGVDSRSLRRLDLFEGELYHRTPVLIELQDGETLMAQTYLVKPEYENRLTSESWSLADFRENHLESFMNSYQGFFSIKAGQ